MNKKELSYIKENYFSKSSESTDLKLIYEMIDEVSQTLSLLEQPTTEEISVVWNGIPELQMSELAWGAAAGEGENPSNARVQLERFLEHVGVSPKDDIKVKLRALESFYTKSEKTGKTKGVGKTSLARAGINVDDPRETIGRIIGYLTFYKTLTMILQNFNASAAGFTFESFIAVLLGGEQIPTGNQTIADLTSRTGKPISLKLLTDEAANVKGSMTDLVDDLAGRGSMPVERMEYLVCLKSLAGEGPTLEGVIKFHRFYYDYENMLDFLTATGGKYANNLRLPLGEDGVTPDAGRQLRYTEPVPSYSGEPINDDNQEWWQANFEEAFDDILGKNPGRIYRKLGVAIDYNPNDAQSFKEAVFELQGEQGQGMSVSALEEQVLKLFPDLIEKSNAATRRNVRGHPAFSLARLVNATLKELHGKLVASAKTARQEAGASAASPGNYASVEDSVKLLRELHDSGDREAFFNAMTNSYGYVTRKQWIVTGKQIETITKSIGEESYLGRLFIGQSYVYEMVNLYAEIMNEKVFEIFRELKVLTAALQDFFTGGLQPPAAEQAIASSNSIGEKTAKVEEEI
jgi:hypothetical protein